MKRKKSYYNSTYGGRRTPLWLKIVLVLVVLAVACFAVLEGVVIGSARTQMTGEPDVMVILGAQVKDTGPSVLLADRLDTALAYLESHPELPVVVSGGQGPDEPTTEAAAMRDYLTARGVAAERILLEDASHNTSQNLVNTRALLERAGYDLEQTHLLVVSNGFHLARVRMLAQRHGLDCSTLAAPSSHAWFRFVSYVREAPALVKSFVFDR